MHPRLISCRAAVICLMLTILCNSSAIAGTTGALVGVVTDVKGAPIAAVVVSASSAAQTETARTDLQGRFTMASLVPDTYVLYATKSGYDPATLSGVEISADSIRSVNVVLGPTVHVLEGGTVYAPRGLVRSGAVADVYTVNAQTQSKVAALGGGGGIDNAYSAIAAAPGTFVPPSQTGWNQPIFLRGGDFSEIGYELDGVPLNRSFDHIPTTNLSSLGQQELQVYTGGAPAEAESNGLSGYINQVIRQGTYPGWATATLGIGAPALYNKVNLEVGGATPNHRFSYYVGTSIADQAFRYLDQSNGATFTTEFGNPFDLQFAALGPLNQQFGQPGCGLPNGSDFTGCYANHAFFRALPAGPGGYILGPYTMGHNSNIADRENVANIHVGIPRANGRMDDLQLLYDTSELYTYNYSSYLDWGGQAFWQGINGQAFGLKAGSPPFPTFVPGFAYAGGLGQAVTGTPGGAITGVLPYLYPGTMLATATGALPLGQRDASSNGQSIIKAQFQHNFSSDAYIRGYVYSAYSNWFVNSPNSLTQLYIVNSADRELSTHSTGFTVRLASEINGSNLMSAQFSYSTSRNVSVDNQQTSTSQPAPQSLFAALVNSASPLSGICNSWDFNPADAPAPSSCEPTTAFALQGLGPAYLRYGGPYVAPPAGFEWLAVENGATGDLNSVRPKSGSVAVQDEWHPTQHLALNAGVRFDRFEFDLPSTAGGATRAFWFNAWNAVMCVNPGVNGGNPIDETILGLPAGAPCSAAGPGWGQAHISNSTANGSTLTYNEFQPRLGGTYTFSGDDVVRFSYGGYAQAPQTQFLQYNTSQQNLANSIGGLYYALGYTTPEHDVRPAVSYNADASWEHQFKNTDVTFSLTPFYRRTRDQVQQFFIDPSTGTISGVNAGRQSVAGAEFALTKGTFGPGLSARLSLTYTRSRISYAALPNGSTLLSPVNGSIQLYNSYTSACANAQPSTNPMSLCGVYGNTNSVATELSGVANPYFNDPARPLLDPNGSYPTYHIVPTGLQLSSASYGVPIAASLLLNERAGRWTFAPVLQFVAGSRYGAPQQQIGIDPATCAALNNSGSVSGDNRYPHGGTGNPYDATTCRNTITIPDQFTGNFDTPGAFREPSFLTAHMQVAYDLSARATLKVNLVNMYAHCFGGDPLPWTISDGRTCGYDTLPGHIPPVGNIYNPGDPIQRIVRYPYGNALSAQPFNAYVNLEVKL